MASQHFIYIPLKPIQSLSTVHTVAHKMLKSALTAALGGDAPAKTSARPSVATSGLLSNVAFPCLRHADADDGATAPTVEASTGFDTVDITTANLTGTGATNVPSSMVRSRVRFQVVLQIVTCLASQVNARHARGDRSAVRA